MAIFRNNTQQYSIVSHAILRDERLSLKDIGLLVRLLSLPDNWEFSENGLIAICKNDGRASIRSSLKNIENCKYLIRRRVRDNDGTLSGIEWNIYDKPYSDEPKSDYPKLDNPKLDNPKLDNPKLDNRPQHNTKEPSIKEPNNNEPNSIYDHCDSECGSKPKRFTPPTVDEVRAYCNERSNHVNAEVFVDFYTSNGWKVGKNPMRDWRASVRTWERSEQRGFSKPKPQPQTANYQQHDRQEYADFEFYDPLKEMQ